MFCPRCGAENPENAVRCIRCGAGLVLAPGVAGPPAAATGPSGVEVLIPYKNAAALTAYYLGIFSIVCGLLLGIPALILGIMGLRNARLHPEARGKVHAWIGIVLGGLMTVVSVVVIVAAVVGLAAQR